MALYTKVDEIDNDDLTDEEADQLALTIRRFIREDTDADPGAVEIKGDEWAASGDTLPADGSTDEGVN